MLFTLRQYDIAPSININHVPVQSHVPLPCLLYFFYADRAVLRRVQVRVPGQQAGRVRPVRGPGPGAGQQHRNRPLLKRGDHQGEV